MSAAPGKQSSWLKLNYEKISLVTVLVVLLGSSVFLVLSITGATDDLKNDGTGFTVGGSKAEPVDVTPFKELQDDLVNPFQAAVSTNFLMVSELRVSCVRIDCQKPIPFDAKVCAFCQHPQPIVTEYDRDLGGLPDTYEVKYGLDPRDPEDDVADTDEDGFTNIEEYLSHTDPTDAESTPDITAKLRLVRIATREFKMRFTGVQNLRPDGDASGNRYQLNLNDLGRTYFAKMDEEIEGYKIVDYKPLITKDEDGRVTDLSEITLDKEGHKTVLVKNRIDSRTQRYLQFILLIDRSTIAVQQDEPFTLRDKEYKVVDITSEGVLVLDLSTQEEKLIPQLSQEEVRILRGERAPTRPEGMDATTMMMMEEAMMMEGAAPPVRRPPVRRPNAVPNTRRGAGAGIR